MADRFGEDKNPKQDGLGFKDKFEAAIDTPGDLLLTPKAQAKQDDSHCGHIDDSWGLDTPQPLGRTVSIADHLDAGRRIAAEKAKAEAELTDLLERKRQAHWGNLLLAAAHFLGDELAAKVEPKPPPGFTIDTELVSVTIRPFDRAPMDVEFACALEKGENHGRTYLQTWGPRVNGFENKAICVKQDWRASAEGPINFVATRTHSVAEAVHLCSLESGAYDIAKATSAKMTERNKFEQVGGRLLGERLPGLL